MSEPADTDLAHKMLVVSFLGQAVMDYGIMKRPKGSGCSALSIKREIKSNGGMESIMRVLNNSDKLLASIGMRFSSSFLIRQIDKNKRISRGTISAGSANARYKNGQ